MTCKIFLLGLPALQRSPSNMEMVTVICADIELFDITQLLLNLGPPPKITISPLTLRGKLTLGQRLSPPINSPDRMIAEAVGPALVCLLCSS